MRAVIQRVSEAKVEAEGKITGKIGKGLLVLLGIGKNDCIKDFQYIANKVANLRIFQDEDEKFNKSLIDIKGDVLIVSQFTLYGDCRKGRRPSFDQAGRVEESRKIYNEFVKFFKEQYPELKVREGVFQAYMQVSLINDGPVTFILDSSKII
jgi:D-tyrosyl-tRNA(Tyr) deacylase